MTNINVRVVGTANVTQMSGAFGKLEEQVGLLNTQLKEMVVLSKGVDPAGYERMARAAALNSKVFRNAAASTGMFEVQQLRVNSATDEYIKKLNAQKLSFREMAKQQRVANAAYKEQLAMQDMIVRKNAGGAARGRSMLDVVVPNEVASSLDTAGKRLAFMNAQLKSGATQLINWGKNTQWAGRQLMVGFTMPIAAFGAAAGVMAYKVDQEFTRVKKVYDTTANQVSGNISDMIAVQQEFTKLQADSYATATDAAQQYGVKMQDTMSVMADLAATGQKGAALQKATTEVVKNAMLGEIDYQTTTKATIALQQTLHMNTKQLADTWAYMNSVENATSLSMADFAQAIPIALGPLKQMGGTVQTLGTLLTGMVSRGIQVGKAANAIKAAAQRLLRPSKQVQQEFAQITGYSITKIAEKNKGNLLGMLQDIYQVTKNLTQLQRGKALAGLFGSYQLGTMSAMVNSMGDLAKGVGQVSKAQEIGQQSAKKWGDVQRLEIGQMQKSISGQFKIAVATLQSQLVNVGKPFIQVGTVVIKFITGIVKAFNSMPNIAKWGIAGAAAFAALAGPVVMLTGLFANLVGNILKGVSSFTGLFVKMDLLDKESRAAKLAADLASAGFASEASAVDKLRQELMLLTAAQKEANAAAREARVTEMVAGGMTRGQAYGTLAAERRKTLVATGAPLGKVQGPLTREQAALAEKEAVAAERTAKGFKGAAGGAALAGAAIVGTMLPGTNETADKALNMVMTFSLLTPMVSGLPAMFKRAGTAITGLGGGVKGAARGAAGLVGSFARLALGPAGLISLAVIGIGLVVKKIRDADSAQQRFNNQAENLSKIYGYQTQQIGQMVNPKTGQAMDTLYTRAQKYRDTMGEVVGAIKSAYDEGNKLQALHLAENIGLQVRNSGGSAKQAQQAVRDSLYAALGNKAQVEQLMVHLHVNFKVDKQVIQASLNQVQSQLSDMIHNRGTQSFDSMALNLVLGHDYKGQAADAAKAAGETFIRVFNNQTTQEGKSAVARMMTEQMKQTDEELLKHYEQAAPRIKHIVEQAGITRMSQLDALVKKQSGRTLSDIGAGQNPFGGAASPAARQAMQNYLRFMEGQRMMAQKIADAFGVQLKDVKNIDVVMKAMNPNFLTISQAQEKFKQATMGNNQFMNQGLELVTHQVAGHKELNKQEQLTLLNQLRVRAGLEKTGTLADKFSDTVTKKWNPGLDKTDQKAKDISSELNGLKDKKVNVSISFSGQDYVNILQQGMQGVQEQMSNDISAGFDKRMQSALDARQKMWDNREAAQSAHFEAQSKAMDARFEREQTALSNHWQHRKDAAQKYWDAQIKNVEKEITAEQKADDLRQKMFEAEIARINALNDAANQNIDFNVALTSGKLDEAAKIRNDAAAKQAETALQAAADAGSARSQARIDRLNKRRDAVQARADAYMKRLDKEEAHAQAALKKREDAEKAHLAKMQAMREKALKAQAEADMKEQQAEWDRRKKSLDQQLALFTSYIAKNKKDLEKHLKDVGLSYAVFGKDKLLPMGKSWSQYFGDQLQYNIRKAGEQIASDKMWKNMGAGAAKQVLDAFGFSDMAEFKNFIKTGNMPSGKKDKTGSSGHNYTNTRDVASQKPTHRHEGGWIGRRGGKDSRKGVARSLKGEHPSEQLVRAKKGEFFVNADAASRNATLLEQINAGRDTDKHYKPNSGGYSPGVAGMVSAIMNKMLIQGIVAAMSNVASRRMAEYQASQMTGVFGAAKAGRYGDITFSAEQLKNAKIIADVGKSMGLGARDIEIGIMTAITESGLRNLHYGDRDSQGLFQQRPSAGWGTVAQVTDPQYAAHKFFSVLKGVSNRASLSPWMAAQTVQRSAYADGSNYHQYWNEAEAIFKGMGKAAKGNAAGLSGYVAGPGGRHRPINRPVTNGLHDAWTGYPAVDFAAPVGTPVYAVADGRISKSYDLRGYEPRRAGYGKPQDGYYSYGRVMYLKTDAGPEVLYAHLSRRGLQAGAHVRGGSIIGRSGDTGNSTGAHLHFGSKGASPYAWMKEGGHTLNSGLAMLHPQETVLTKPLSHDLSSVVSLLGSTARGMSRANNGNIASGNVYHYNVSVNVDGADLDADEVATKVVQIIKRTEKRKPNSRRG